MPVLKHDFSNNYQKWREQLTAFGAKVQKHFGSSVKVLPPYFSLEPESKIDTRMMYRASLKIEGTWETTEFGYRNSDPQILVDVIIEEWTKFLRNIDADF